jgi:hypothetical protein
MSYAIGFITGFLTCFALQIYFDLRKARKEHKALKG